MWIRVLSSSSHYGCLPWEWAYGQGGGGGMGLGHLFCEGLHPWNCGAQGCKSFGWLPRAWCGWSLLGSPLLAPDMGALGGLQESSGCVIYRLLRKAWGSASYSRCPQALREASVSTGVGALGAPFAALTGAVSQKLLGLSLTNPWFDMPSPSHLGLAPAESLGVGKSPSTAQLPDCLTWTIDSVSLSCWTLVPWRGYRVCGQEGRWWDR